MYCPGIKENNQYVESQEDKSVEIIVEIKLHPGLADGLHTAFEYGVLNRIGVIGDNFKISEDIGENYHYQAEKKDNYKE